MWLRTSLCVSETCDPLICDDGLGVEDIAAALSIGALDGIAVHSSEAPHSASKLPDGLALVLLHGAQLDPVDGHVPLAHGDLLQLGNDSVLSGGVCSGRECPVMISSAAPCSIPTTE